LLGNRNIPLFALEGQYKPLSGLSVTFESAAPASLGCEHCGFDKLDI
jgi:hypothetical protein